MDSYITIYPDNILEDGTVTVTGTADTGYPESRLYDRAISLFWQDTVTEAKTFVIDYGAAVAVDFLSIEKHNFNGADMQWQYSETGAWAGEEVDAVTDWTQSGNTQIIKTMAASQSKQYWRVTLSSMANPRCSEIYMSLGYDFNIKANPGPAGSRISNVQWNRTVGGSERSIRFGDRRRRRSYQIHLSSADLTTWRTVLDFLGEMEKPFYIKDHEGDYFLCHFAGDPDEMFYSAPRTMINLDVIEVL